MPSHRNEPSLNGRIPPRARKALPRCAPERVEVDAPHRERRGEDEENQKDEDHIDERRESARRPRRLGLRFSMIASVRQPFPGVIPALRGLPGHSGALPRGSGDSGQGVLPPCRPHGNVSGLKRFRRQPER